MHPSITHFGNGIYQDPDGKQFHLVPISEVPGTEFDIGWFLVFDVALCLFLLLIAGVTSGLNVGLFSIDPLRLRILEVQGNALEQNHAKRILGVLKNRNLLLVTLLIANAVAIEALPLVLTKFVPSIVAIIVSVPVVLFFSEILPQGFCTSTPIAASARLATLTQVFIIVLYPISKPISFILDGMFGKQAVTSTLFNRNEIRTLIALQLRSDGMSQRPRSKESPGISLEEVTIIQGVLKLSEKIVDEFYIPLNDVFMLEENEKLDEKQMANIIGKGFSRIPVYRKHRNNIIGYVIVKRLCALNPQDGRPVLQVAFRKPRVVHPTMTLFEVLREFQRNQSHFAVVSYDVQFTQQWNKDNTYSAKILGIVTLEDIFGQMLQESIPDETETLKRNPKKGTSSYSQKRVRGVAKAILKFNQLLLRARARNKYRLGRTHSIQSGNTALRSF